METLTGKKITRIEKSDGLSENQIVVWNALKGRTLLVKKLTTGKNLKCDLCQKKSRVAHSAFCVVENEKHEDKMIAAGCLAIYFGLEISSKRSAKNRVTL